MRVVRAMHAPALAIKLTSYAMVRISNQSRAKIVNIEKKEPLMTSRTIKIKN